MLTYRGLPEKELKLEWMVVACYCFSRLLHLSEKIGTGWGLVCGKPQFVRKCVGV